MAFPLREGRSLLRGSISPGLEIRVCKSANVRRADKDTVPVGLSYVYAVDNRTIEDPDFQSGCFQSGYLAAVDLGMLLSLNPITNPPPLSNIG